MTKTLADYTSPELIIGRLNATEPMDAIFQLSFLLQRAGRINDPAQAVKVALNRERLSPTAMAPGWAIPHARLNYLSRVSFGLARCSEPMNWFDQTGIQVTSVFFCVVPEMEVASYLALISGLAKLSQDPIRAARLQASSSVAETFKLLGEVPVRLPSSTVRT